MRYYKIASVMEVITYGRRTTFELFTLLLHGEYNMFCMYLRDSSGMEKLDSKVYHIILSKERNGRKTKLD